MKTYDQGLKINILILKFFPNKTKNAQYGHLLMQGIVLYGNWKGMHINKIFIKLSQRNAH